MFFESFPSISLSNKRHSITFLTYQLKKIRCNFSKHFFFHYIKLSKHLFKNKNKRGSELLSSSSMSSASLQLPQEKKSFKYSTTRFQSHQSLYNTHTPWLHLPRLYFHILHHHAKDTTTVEKNIENKKQGHVFLRIYTRIWNINRHFISSKNIK